MEDKYINYLKDFDNYCQKWDMFLTDGNHKEANSCYKKIKQIYEKVRISDNKHLFYITLVKESNNLRTISTACTQMLILNIEVELAEQKLKQISLMNKEKSSAVFSSKIVLQEWEKGNLMKF